MLTRKVLLFCGMMVMIGALIFLFNGDGVFSHSGGTDSQGGHRNSRTGEYHFHNRKAPKPAPPRIEDSEIKQLTAEMRLLRLEIKGLRGEIALLRK